MINTYNICKNTFFRFFDPYALNPFHFCESIPLRNKFSFTRSPLTSFGSIYLRCSNFPGHNHHQNFTSIRSTKSDDVWNALVKLFASQYIFPRIKSICTINLFMLEIFQVYLLFIQHLSNFIRI